MYIDVLSKISEPWTVLHVLQVLQLHDVGMSVVWASELAVGLVGKQVGYTPGMDDGLKDPLRIDSRSGPNRHGLLKTAIRGLSESVALRLGHLHDSKFVMFSFCSRQLNTQH